MESRGPSPLVPSLMVGALALFVFGPTLQSARETVGETVIPWVPFMGDEEDGENPLSMLLLPLILLLLIHFLTVFFPSWNYATSASYGSSGNNTSEGFGMGAFLLVLLFFVLQSGGFGMGAFLLVLLFFVLQNEGFGMGAFLLVLLFFVLQIFFMSE